MSVSSKATVTQATSLQVPSYSITPPTLPSISLHSSSESPNTAVEVVSLESAPVSNILSFCLFTDLIFFSSQQQLATALPPLRHRLLLETKQFLPLCRHRCLRVLKMNPIKQLHQQFLQLPTLSLTRKFLLTMLRHSLSSEETTVCLIHCKFSSH